MRSIRKSWIGIALAILFGLSLFFFRGSQRYSNLFNSDNIIASVSGTAISTTKFIRALDMNISQFGQMLGKELTGDEIRSFQIHQLVLQNLVNNAIFENEFEDINFIIDDSIIAKRTKERFPNLYINNQINEEVLNTFLRQQKLKIEDLVNIISYETKALVFDDLFFEKKYPLEMQKKISLSESQIRELDLIKMNIEKIKLKNFNEEEIKKNNTELIKFYNDNNNKYMTEEKRDILYILINKQKYETNFTPSEYEINEYYINNKKLFTIPEKRSFIQFNFKSKDEAIEFRKIILGKQKENIINIANEKNITFNEFDDLAKFQVLDDLASSIFTLDKGNISEVIETTLANHIIFLESINNEREPSIIEVKEEIKKTLTNVQLDNFYDELKLNISQKILDGNSIKDISLENSFEIKEILKAKFSNVENDDIESQIINNSFSSNLDFTSDLFEYDENNAYVLFVNKIYESEPKEMEKIFETVKKDWINSKKINFAKEIFEKNNDINKIKSIFNEDLTNLETTLKNSEFPFDLTKKIFESNINDISFSIDKNIIFFAKVKNIKFPNQIDQSSEINVNSDLKNAFGSEIIKTKSISLNDELINGILSQY